LPVRTNELIESMDAWNEKYSLSEKSDMDNTYTGVINLYGNGYTLNMHSLTFPSGEGTQTAQGVTNIYPTAKDVFQGAVDFVAICVIIEIITNKIYKNVSISLFFALTPIFFLAILHERLLVFYTLRVTIQD
jgi:hypothetical protein